MPYRDHPNYREAFHARYGVESKIWPSHMKRILAKHKDPSPLDPQILEEMLDYDANARSIIRQWIEKNKWAGPITLD